MVLVRLRVCLQSRVLVSQGLGRHAHSDQALVGVLARLRCGIWVVQDGFEARSNTLGVLVLYVTNSSHGGSESAFA